MKRKLVCVIAAIVVALFVGACDVPELLEAQINFYDQSGTYLHSVEMVEPNQKISLPALATTLEIQFQATASKGKRLPYDYIVRGGENQEHVIKEGYQGDVEEPVYVSIVCRDAAGNAMFQEYSVEIETRFTIDGPYHDETPWTSHRSFVVKM